MAASASLTADKTTASPGDRVVFTPRITGLRQPVTVTGAGHVDATLSDGTSVSADSPAVSITTPGQTVVSVTVTFQGSVLTANPDGTYTATVR
jgi:hypothetical protein